MLKVLVAFSLLCAFNGFADYKNFLEARKDFESGDSYINRHLIEEPFSCVKYSVDGSEEAVRVIFRTDGHISSSDLFLNQSSHFYSSRALMMAKKVNNQMARSYQFSHLRQTGPHTYVIESSIWPGEVKKLSPVSDQAPRGAELLHYYICL